MTIGVPCMLMRGGTSKGAYFLKEDLPSDPDLRDEWLLRIMGSPDARQIDGLGGAHPLTSKVAVIERREHDIGYLFLQVSVDEALVSDKQNCGNLLAGVGPFALERGLWPVTDGHTEVPIFMQNTGARAVAVIETPYGRVEYDGETVIDGTPGRSAPIVLNFEETSGEHGLLPTGNVQDIAADVPVTCIDNGMPTVVVRASDLGITGTESPAELEDDPALCARIEAIRLEAGALMKLGDVTATTVPKVSIVSEPLHGGAVCTRTFIPHRVHEAIGVLGAASVAACLLVPGSVAYSDRAARMERLSIEHPTGAVDVEIELDGKQVLRTGLVRTARPIMDGIVFPRPRLQ